MLELKAEYLQKFPVKLKILKELTELRSWQELENEYHKLKGTGKTFGFPEVSLVCEKLEGLALTEFPDKTEFYLLALLFFEDLYQSYLLNQPLDLQKNIFSRSLLALKTE